VNPHSKSEFSKKSIILPEILPAEFMRAKSGIGVTFFIFLNQATVTLLKTKTQERINL
jgi:hypothetical protein